MAKSTLSAYFLAQLVKTGCAFFILTGCLLKKGTRQTVFDLIPAAWIPLVIFLARICDVSLGTLRILFVSKGMRLRAAVLGFLEVLIWIIVVAQLFQHLNNWLNFIAFAGGFAVGTYLGMYIENKLKVGTLIMRVITAKPAEELANELKEAGFRLTRVEAKGGIGPVEILFHRFKKKALERSEKYR